MKDRTAIEENTLKMSMIGAFILAVWGIIMAAVSSSGAILLDGMYNLLSGILSYFFIHITRLVSGKTTRDYPLGYFAYESLFVFIKGTSILLLLIMALYFNIEVLLSGGREPALGMMTIYVGVAVLGCLILYFISRRSVKKTGSEILETETQAWLINAVISGCIGVALGITMLLQGTSLGWIDRYVDQVLVILMSLAFIRDPLVFMKNGIRELLLTLPQQEYITPFENKFQSLKEQLKARKLKLEIMKTGRRIWVTVRLTPREDTIHLHELDTLRETMRKAAMEVYENTDTEVILESS